jgi:hypothetical protein
MSTSAEAVAMGKAPAIMIEAELVMTFRDVPSLLRFEQYARVHSEDVIVMDCYRRIREVITHVPKPEGAEGVHSATVEDLKASCEAVEKSTRLMWACAVATDNVRPALWDYRPDYEQSVTYFLSLADLDLMALTQKHRLKWDTTGW